MENLFQDSSKKELLTKKFYENIVKAFFINTINECCLNLIHMQKKCYFHATTAIKQTTTISFINETLIIMLIVKIMTLLSYYVKV